MRCAICHKVIIPDILGLAPKVIEIYVEEQFIVHHYCAVEFVEKYNKLSEEDRVSFVETQLGKMSN